MKEEISCAAGPANVRTNDSDQSSISKCMGNEISTGPQKPFLKVTLDGIRLSTCARACPGGNLITCRISPGSSCS